MLLECCVDSLESAISAKQGGADRLELCGNLLIGGTTPSHALFCQIRERVSIPIRVLLRPRFGDFLYSSWEWDEILQEARWFYRHGADGLVSGVLCENGRLNCKAMHQLTEIAQEKPVTLHRAFDVARDAEEALEDAKNIGISTILTSGQKASALEGAQVIAQLAAHAEGIEIMAGSGVTSDNIGELIRLTASRSYHMSGKRRQESAMKYRKKGVPMGLPLADEYSLWKTDSQEIFKAKRVLEQWEQSL